MTNDPQPRRLQRELVENQTYPLRIGLTEESWADEIVVPDPSGNRLVFHTPRGE